MLLNHFQLAVHQDPQVVFSTAAPQPVILEPVFLQDIPFRGRTLHLSSLNSMGLKNCSKAQTNPKAMGKKNPTQKNKQKQNPNPHLIERPLAKHLGMCLSAWTLKCLDPFWSWAQHSSTPVLPNCLDWKYLKVSGSLYVSFDLSVHWRNILCLYDTLQGEVGWGPSTAGQDGIVSCLNSTLFCSCFLLLCFFSGSHACIS